jgi:YD repeat-containing protein
MPISTIFVTIWLISLWVYFRRGKSAMRAIVIAAGLHIVVAALIWGGPLSSGALFLLLPAPVQARPADLPYSYRPVHKGHVDLATGLYIREDDDFIVSESPAFVWRRAYLSRDRVARHLGIGTTHNAEWYLMGDLADLRRVELVREDGTRVAFDRTSRGTSYGNAMFVHTATPTGFYGAQLGWVGQRWALRFANGVLAIFKACETADNPCSLISARDTRGRVVRFNRDERGVLRTIEAGSQRLTFEYDDKRRRIVRAVQGLHEATYSYDDRGRLVRSTVSGVTRSFRYGSRDEMITIEEPNRTIENTYDDDLRVTRQVLRRSGRPDNVHSFEYSIHGKAIVETAVTWPNGSRTTYRWNEKRRQDLEIYEGAGESPIMVQYARADGVFTGSLTISCTKDGRPVSETVEVWPGEESRVKHEVIERICSE